MTDTQNIDQQLLQQLRQRAQNQGISVNDLLADFLASDTSTQQTPYAYLDASPSAVTIVDVSQPHQPAIYVNRAFEEETGYLAKEVIGRNLNFLQGDDRDQPGRLTIREAIQQGQSCTVVLRDYRKDGSIFWNELRLAPLPDEQGNLTRYIGIQNDVTERKQAADALREREVQLRWLIDNMPILINAFNAEKHMTVWNRECERVTGYQADEIVGNPHAIEMLYPDPDYRQSV